MAEKKIVVQVLADTKPFINSIMKLRKFAESADSAQIKASNKILKNLVQNAKINQKIQKITQKNAKLQQKTAKDSEEAQDKTLKSAIKYGAIISAIAKSYRMIKGGFLNSYEFGRSLVGTPTTYGVDLTKSTQANAIYSAFGGKAGEGVNVLGKFLQNRLDYMLYQSGPLKEAAGRFGISQKALLSEDLTDFIKELRRVRSERGLSREGTQGLLQAVGLGYDDAIMRMVTGSDEEFNKTLKESEKIAKSSKERLKAMEETEKSFETMMTNIKTQMMDWATYLKPVIDGFNKLGPATEAAVATMLGVAGVGASLGFVKSAAVGSGVKSAAGIALKTLGVGSLYVSTAIIGGMIGHKWSDSAAESKRKLESGQKMGYWEHFGHYMNSLIADSAYDLADMISGVYEERKAEQLQRVGRGSVTYNVNVQSPASSDPYTYGERVGQSLNNQITSNLYLNGGSL